MRAGIALGSNLGERWRILRDARARILRVETVSGPCLSSAIYETEPIGCEPGAAAFLNAVIEVAYDGEPDSLLRSLLTIELSLGRPDGHERNSSRTIDLDLLYLEEVTAKNNFLILPHPRMHERRFVLQPLADLRPELVLPGQSQRVDELLARLPAEDMKRLPESW